VGGAGLLVKYYGKNRDEILKSVKVFDSINQLYHTGDRGYYDERGVIHYLDREDNQVKIRGYRLDLSYIEEIVNQSKLVDLCSAIKVKDGNFDKLILFCCKKKSNKSVAAIKKEVFSYLEKKIPMFYLPSDIIILNSIPINKNGKVNKEDLKDFLEKKSMLSGYEKKGTDS
jgi:acyl-coenzyme A synthetase/AMP-(fatty) acid ligase